MKIIPLEELQERFNSVLSTITEKQSLINLELQEIVNYLNYTPPLKRHKMDFLIEPETDAIFILTFDLNQRKLLKRAFNGFNVYGEFELKESKSKFQRTIDIEKKVILQAFEFSKYFKWLKELEFKPNTTQNKSKLTLNQKVLALHYLGLDLRNYDKTKSSKVLSQIIGEDESNTRKSLSYINSAIKEEKVKNKQNLKKLIELFENEQFDTIKRNLKEDLGKVEVTG